MTEEQKVVRKMKNSDRQNHAAQNQEAMNAGVSTVTAAHYNLPPGSMLPSPFAPNTSQSGSGFSSRHPGSNYDRNTHNHTHSHKRSRVSSSGNIYKDAISPTGHSLTPPPNYVPPNQEQMALMEELSIEYHNLYSKRATVEDVISNVPVSINPLSI